MADNDYKELMEFLGKQFEDMDKRMDAKITAAKEETMRHTGVIIEEVQHKLELLTEGINGINEKMERGRVEHEGEHGRLEKMTLINTADISKLDQRVGRLEGTSS